VHGEGLFRTIETSDADGLIAAMAAQGVQVGKAPSGAVRVAPHLDISAADLDRLEAVARSISRA
jgi:acetylornithine/succinyldiaminopimelate/putrescine aminotransferase